jgi:hypothetical protein
MGAALHVIAVGAQVGELDRGENISVPTTATSGAGTGLTVNYFAGPDGQLATHRISVAQRGSGYEVGDTFTVEDPKTLGKWFGEVTRVS